MSQPTVALRVMENPSYAQMPTLRLLAPMALLSCACSTFSTVRSAEITPGVSTTGQVSRWPQTGLSVLGADVGLTFASSDTVDGLAFGLGTSGVYPYLEVYTQQGHSTRMPSGIGGRLGLPAFGRAEHRLFGRIDFVSANGMHRVLWNPGLFLNHRSSPNGEPNTVAGFANGLGTQVGKGTVVWTPSISLVHARDSHGSYYRRPEWTTFMTAAVGVTFRRQPVRQ